MRVLWLCNIIIPGICKKLKLEEINLGGWLDETFEKLIECDDIQFAYCAPFQGDEDITYLTYKKAKFYGFKKKKNHPHQYDKSVEKLFLRILNEFSPDVVHIFGTEFPHSLSMTRVFSKPEKILVHIQGLAFIWGGAISLFYHLLFITA